MRRSSHVCYIIPPHIHDRLIEQPEYRARAFRNLALAERLRGRRDVFAQFITGLSTGQERRTIYDGENGIALPGKLVRGEGDPATADDAVNEAYDFSGATYDFYQAAYNRNSIDDQGMRLDSTVHYDQDFDNAFWDGRQMVYGDGDEVLFQRFTKCIDVVGHELTHGVTENTAQLIYQDQPGALNESMSDVFGSLVKQMNLNQTADEADWLIGAGLFSPDVNAAALRSMKEPGTAYDDPRIGKDPQPADMTHYVDTSTDHGGVHINSSIPNRAFCVTALELGGHAWERAGRIWYVTLTTRLRFNADFQTAADTTFTVAGELYGSGSSEQQAVRKGWDTVGISVNPAFVTKFALGAKSIPRVAAKAVKKRGAA
jgi:Zn-dependent metalloprotease